MQKNLLNAAAAEMIVARVQQLTPATKARWGRMNASEMLLHCNRCNEEVFCGSGANRKTTAKQYLLRVLALYLAPTFKKNIKGAAKNETVGEITSAQFEAEKQKFIRLVRRFPQHREPVTLHHIAFGNLSSHQWGIALYKHMDHHLRQFGV